jgi:hypothetical protein
MKENKFWFVEFPTHQYNEDVMDLAYTNRLEVVDARFKESIDPKFSVSSKEAPKLTKKK